MAHHFLVVLEREAEEIGGDVAGEIVGRRAEAAGDEHDVGAAEGFAEAVADGVAVGDGSLALDAQAEGKEFLGEQDEVGIGDAAQHEFGAGIEDFDAHGGTVQAEADGVQPHSFSVRARERLTYSGPTDGDFPLSGTPRAADDSPLRLI